MRKYIRRLGYSAKNANEVQVQCIIDESYKQYPPNISSMDLGNKI